MRDELAEVVATVASDDALGALVITGAGRAFCAGADIGYMHDLVAREEWDTIEALVNLGAQVVLAIDSLGQRHLVAMTSRCR